MGEPNTSNLYYLQSREIHCELKYLSSNGQEIKRDSLSSDERNGKSPNCKYCIGSFWCYRVVGITLGEANKPNIF